ncbi:MAG: hypothetical protein A2X36_15670 [Elusimicrobia bacterium GWA2_69_24]|nr:MAG: hypothetical protein A2X36_15670 [Elusimicrobia bacterium GWA2_69_24]
MNDPEFRKEVDATAARILESLGRLAPGRAEKTVWELKMELKVSHTTLHLALGMLMERGALALRPDKLTYAVTPQPSPQPAPQQ